MLCSIVVPVYNTATTLIDLAKRVENVFEGSSFDYELLFVDDHSSNQSTWKTILMLADRNPRIKGFRLSRNFGQQPATLCGIDNANGDYVVTMDDDLQHNPEDILQLLEQKGHDIVIGQYVSKKHSLWRNLVSLLKGYFDHLLIGKPKSIQLTSFRLLNRTVVDGIKKIHTAYPFLPAMMFYVSKDVIGVAIKHNERTDGKTGYSLLKLVKLFSNLMVNNSSFLLRMIGVLGLSIAVISFVLGIYFIIRSFYIDIETTGWTSTIVVLLFIGGMILLSIGVIGDYLIRIISSVEKRPTYIIRESSKG